MTTDEPRPVRDDPDQPANEQGIGATNYAASASEAGGLYSDRGPTLADAEGDPVTDEASEPEAADGGQSAGDVTR
ncbi:MAG: hypothetical protein M3295_06745 [Chloroflexota bacterium]|nr:hypothetical protein [Chloroflexota bacterium]